jgi:hypothetical protein
VRGRAARDGHAPGHLNYGWPAAPPSSTRRFMFNALAEPGASVPCSSASASFQNRPRCMHAQRSWLGRASRVLEGGAMSNPTPNPRATYPHAALAFTCHRENSQCYLRYYFRARHLFRAGVRDGLGLLRKLSSINHLALVLARGAVRSLCVVRITTARGLAVRARPCPIGTFELMHQPPPSYRWPLTPAARTVRSLGRSSL